MSVRCQAPVNFIMQGCSIPRDLLALPGEGRSLHPVMLRISSAIKVLAIGVFSIGKLVDCLFSMGGAIVVHLVNFDLKEARLSLCSNLKEVARCALRVVACVPAFFIALILPRALLSRIEDSLRQAPPRPLRQECQRQTRDTLELDPVDPQISQLSAEISRLEGANFELTIEKTKLLTNHTAQIEVLIERWQAINQIYKECFENSLGEGLSTLILIEERIQRINEKQMSMIEEQDKNIIEAVGMFRFYYEQQKKECFYPPLYQQPVDTIRRNTKEIVEQFTTRRGALIEVLRQNGYNYDNGFLFEQ